MTIKETAYRREESRPTQTIILEQANQMMHFHLNAKGLKLPLLKS